MSVIHTAEGYGLGWLPDLPDHRDFDPSHGKRDEPETEEIPNLLARMGVEKTEVELASSVDLRDGFTEIEDQGDLGSCTAQAGVGLLEYFEHQAFARHIDASRLFLYKATRNLMGVTGDTGAFLRTTMQALVLFGVPPEEYLPYDIDTFDDEPPAFAYAFAQSYRALQFYRLDPQGTARADLLQRIKTNLAGKLPSMFGFTVYASYTQANRSGEIPFPARRERRLGGHAVVAAGYDDDKVVKNKNNGQQTTGALLIRNSWGSGWGDDGYGWLPYDYVSAGLAVDWWSLLESGWVDTGAFGLG